jgi:serine/threonine-protein kinase RsbT
VAVAVTRSQDLPLRTDEDVVRARQVARQWSVELGFSLVDQTKSVTAASELARNTVLHGGGGGMTLEMLQEGARRGLRLVFDDQGPGIADVQQALKDGFTTGGGLGLGLSGSRRLMSEFAISSQPGQGTKVTTVRWR